MCQISWKSESLNLLEPSGLHRACYGTPLPLQCKTNIIRKINDHYDILTELTSKAFSSLKYKELKTNIFRTGKPQSILHHPLKLYMRGDSTYSTGFGSIEIIVVCDVTQYNLVEMQQFL
jgi:hypothetical protein